jgi:7-cyano-7-deazaguanine synthase in queuosine biosynthesis
MIRIPVPVDYTRIGVAMSGGMDSMVLMSELATQLDPSKVTVYTVDLKTSVSTVAEILKALDFPAQHVVLPDPKNPNGALSPSFLEVCKTEDYFYTGITMNPPWADAIPDGQKPHRFNKVQYQNMFMPFGLSTKRDVVELMVKTGRQSLLPLTHTCTERPQGSLSCGTCFACRERQWAFDALNIQDVVEYEV